MIDRIKLQKGQVPTETDWETWLNLIVDMLNAGLSPQYLAKNLANRVVIDIEGDAKTVGGKTADQIAAGDFPEIKKTFMDLIGGGLVLKGGVATKNGTTANQLDITATTVLMKDTSTGYISRVEISTPSKSTTLANATFYLDVALNATDYSFGTSHPSGDYIALAEVATDGSGNIATVNDVRPLTSTMLSGMDGKILIPGANVTGNVPTAVTKSGDTMTGALEFNTANHKIDQIGTHLSLKNKDHTASVTGKVVGILCANAEHDGTNWNRMDTTSSASLIQARSDGEEPYIYKVGAGANPIVWQGPYTVYHSGNLQKGQVTASASASWTASVAVTFPTAFATTPNVVATARVGGWIVTASNVSTTGCTLNLEWRDSSQRTESIPVDWIALI